MDIDRSECFEKTLATRVKFNNPSDALLARLMLTYGISSETLDFIIDAIRDPLFNSKELTLRHSGDVHAQVAKSRTHDILAIDQRSLARSSFSGPPSFIFDEVFNILRAEMIQAIHAARMENDGIGYVAGEARDGNAMVRATMSDLANCSLVHSSWLHRARIALGSCLISHGGPIARSIRSPCFGEWTHELEFSLHKINVQHLHSLFLKLPNLRFVQLNMLDLTIDENTALWINYVLSSLQCLNELVLRVSDANPEEILEKICSLSNPMLETVRIVDTELLLFAHPKFKHFLPLTAIPSMRAIHIQKKFHKHMGGFLLICHLGWAPSVDSSREFMIDTLRCVLFATMRSLGPRAQQLLQQVKNITIDLPSEFRAQNIKEVLDASSSVKTLHLKMTNIALSPPPFRALHALPSSLEALILTFPERRILADLNDWDHALRQGLSAAILSENLKSIDAHFALCDINVSGKLVGLSSACLPKCVHWCKRRQVRLRVSLNGVVEE